MYNGDAYFTTSNIQLVRVPLNELTCDLRTSDEEVLPQYYSVCPDTTHGHDAGGVDRTCPGWLSDPMAQFVIDAYESAGDFPIVYYYCGGQIDPEKEAWDQAAAYGIYRYDTGENTRKCIASFENPVRQMMTYDQLVFFVTQSASNTYQLNAVAKSNESNMNSEARKGVVSISAGEGKLTLLGIYNEQVIFRDDDGAIYKADFDLQNCEKFYQVIEVFTTSTDENFQSVFVHGEYLYFCSDYETVSYAGNKSGTRILKLLRHSVRRVSLDDPQPEGEMVAENVYADRMFGIVNNVFYYSPCTADEWLDGYYFNFTGGLLKGVDLETLKPIEMNEDTGLYFIKTDSAICENALIASAFPVREGYNITYDDDNYICLYDIKTGALYPLYTT